MYTAVTTPPTSTPTPIHTPAHIRFLFFFCRVPNFLRAVPILRKTRRKSVFGPKKGVGRNQGCYLRKKESGRKPHTITWRRQKLDGEDLRCYCWSNSLHP